MARLDPSMAVVDLVYAAEELHRAGFFTVDQLGGVTVEQLRGRFDV